jgi:hypothetical protein
MEYISCTLTLLFTHHILIPPTRVFTSLFSMPRNATAVPIKEVRLSLTPEHGFRVRRMLNYRLALFGVEFVGRVIPQIPVFAGGPPITTQWVGKHNPISTNQSLWWYLGLQAESWHKSCTSRILISLYYCTKTVTYFTLISLPGHPKQSQTRDRKWGCRKPEQNNTSTHMRVVFISCAFLTVEKSFLGMRSI